MNIETRDTPEHRPVEIPSEDIDAHFGVAPGYRLLEEAGKYLPGDWNRRFNHFRVDFKNAVTASDHGVGVALEDQGEKLGAQIKLGSDTEVMNLSFDLRERKSDLVPLITRLDQPVPAEKILEVIPHGERIRLVDQIVGANQTGVEALRRLTAADLKDKNLVFKMTEMIGQVGTWLLLGGRERLDSPAVPESAVDKKVAMFQGVEADFDQTFIDRLSENSDLRIVVERVGDQEAQGFIVNDQGQTVFHNRFTHTKATPIRLLHRMLERSRKAKK